MNQPSGAPVIPARPAQESFDCTAFEFYAISAAESPSTLSRN